MSSSYERDSEGYVHCSVDGSCPNNGRANASAGFGVHFGDNSRLNVSGPVRGRATNNEAEIQGVTEAYRVAKREGIDKMCIQTDSTFTYNSLNNWMDNWKSNGWKTSKGQPVKNRESLQECDNARRAWGGEDKFEVVKGHSGNYGNEQADRLAKEGARRYRY